MMKLKKEREIRIKSCSFVILLFSFSIGTWAQAPFQDLFMEIIEELDKDAQKDKASYQAKYDKSTLLMQQYENEKPQVTVFGANDQEKEEIERAMEATILEQMEVVDEEEVELAPPPIPPPPAPPTVPKEKTIENTPDQIVMTSKPMFPEDQGRELNPPPQPRAQAEEEIVWESSEVFTSSEIIEIDEIQDPIQRQKFKDIAHHQENVMALNRIGLIEALKKESSDAESYQKMITDLNDAGFSLSDTFKRMKILEENDKKTYLKDAVTKIINDIIYQ